MTVQTTITRCPICGGKLQATEVQEVFWTLEELDVAEGLGDSVLALPADYPLDGSDDAQTTSWRFYCENDHSAEDMVAALNGQPQGESER